MRVGDFSVEVVAADGGVREIESGHVLARPGQIYKLRLRNHGPLRAVADISIDGRSVSGRGLVIEAFKSVDLERPIHETERGRFTVIAEGNEQVFGLDGGRDNPDLGLIEARFRRELPDRFFSRDLPSRSSDPWGHPRPVKMPTPDQPPDTSPPRFTPPIWNGPDPEMLRSIKMARRGPIRAFLDAMSPPAEPAAPSLPEPSAPQQSDEILTFSLDSDSIERAAGTGLTGQSSQDFTPVYVGQLEAEATVIRLRLVIGTDEAISAPRPLPTSEHVPARPAARP